MDKIELTGWILLVNTAVTIHCGATVIAMFDNGNFIEKPTVIRGCVSL
jgi:hypothetical protein